MSEIVGCLEKLVPTSLSTTDSAPDVQPCLTTDMPTIDAVILDGAAVVVNLLKPVTACTFAEYASQIYIKAQYEICGV